MSDTHPSTPLSVPARSAAPRRLDVQEWITLSTIADALIPETASSPTPSSEPDFREKIVVALDARADAFGAITSLLASLGEVPAEAMLDRLEAVDADDPASFQAISTVIAGAWLLTAGTRDRIGYHGQQSEKAGLEEAVDEISSGILDPVIERGENDLQRWVR